MSDTAIADRPDEQPPKRSVTVRAIFWGPTGEGVRSFSITLPDDVGADGATIMGVTIEDGGREVSYDTESYEVSLMVDGKTVNDFYDQPIPN